jgi:D-lactate dehydrogenase
MSSALASRERLSPVPERLIDDLRTAVPAGVHHRPTDRLKYAHDASHFLLTPQAVVAPQNVHEVGGVLRVAVAHGVPLTFRSGGTSLSGQGVTAGIMVDTRRNFRDVEVLDNGSKVRVQPGVTVRQVNARLAPYKRKLGPDPASESACTLGGVIANNSSGMLCGTSANAYRTLESLVFVLPSGTVIDSAAADADARLRHLEPAIHAGLVGLRDALQGSPTARAEIERQYALKNTMGYGLNSFLDFHRPVDILAHLLVGSEGTLGFVAEATFRTVPIQPEVATAFLIFPSLAVANGALPGLIDQGIAAIELLDARSLRVAQAGDSAPPALHGLDVGDHAALLVEHQSDDPAALAEKTRQTSRFFAELPTAWDAEFTADPGARAALWHLRKGLYAAVAGARRQGTTALLEDIAVPVRDLADACSDLEELFVEHGYEESVIFGHAKDGNIHFLISERFDEEARLRQYERFTEDLVDLVLARGGTLKAEHGTGRVMAPYVRRQFGDELFEAMVRVKEMVDPGALLNPGVIIAEDPQAHLRDLKPATAVEEEVDRCVECGYCEPVCPSKDLTTTPRQRIVLRREMVAAEAAGDQELARQLRQDYEYDAVDTCAVDGMCQTACPVNINTGDLTRRWRRERSGAAGEVVWNQAARRWGAATSALGSALTTASRLPDPVGEKLSDAARRVAGHDNVPRWDRRLPRGGRRRVPVSADDATAVFLPSCTGSLFSAETGDGVSTAFLALCQRAGVRITVPEGIAGLCCGTPWKSKGRSRGYATMRDRVSDALEAVDPDRRYPVVMDASSCSEGLRELLARPASGAPVDVLDATTFTVQRLLPALTVTRRIPQLAIHPTCSSVRSATSDDLRTIADAISDRVQVPADWGCCAFAGDRGLLHPELTASATQRQAEQVMAMDADAFASSNRTCELAMTRATGKPYRHILELLEEATRP